MIYASLPMYDWPETRPATDAWWEGIARHLGVSGRLTRKSDYVALWREPHLLFSQTCGYPFTHEFRDRFVYAATPHYGVDGCDGPYYQSIVFAGHAGSLTDFRGAVAAVNSPDSMSGMLALQLVFAPYAEQGRFFRSTLETGGHVASMLAVRDGRAGVCAVDAVCIALARRYRPDYLEGLVEIARSPMVPSLPYVTRSGDVARIRAALAAAFADPDLRETRDQLFLTGFSDLPPRAYDRILELESQMQRVGGLKLL